MWKKIRAFIGETVFFVIVAPVTMLGWIPAITGMSLLWFMGLMVILGLGFAFMMTRDD